ncbi:MAG: hypothetical protein NTW91_10830 [Verrucomicrobia bacterium]|nr:hypothetical protein [Verrucomicrobiota bacterium]
MNLSNNDNKSNLDNFKKLKDMYFIINSQIDTMQKDPMYGIKPSMNVSIPGVPVSGMPPQQISDPNLKLAYQEAINRNNEILKFSNRYTRLIHVRRLMWYEIKGYLNNNVSDSVLSDKLLREIPYPVSDLKRK